MTEPNIFVVGVESEPKKTLIRRLTQDGCSNADSVEMKWTIETKYYEMEVAMKSLTLPSDECHTLEDVECEALVLMDVCNLKRPPIRCLVLDHDNEESSEGEWIEEAKYWALDRGFKSIEVALQDPELEFRLPGDDQGVQRLRAAFKVHVWPDYQSTSRGSLPQITPGAQQDPVDEDQFEKLIVDLSGARERIQTLSDRERREAAEEMAIRLAHYFEEDDDEQFG